MNLLARIIARVLGPLVAPFALLRGLANVFALSDPTTTFPPEPGTTDGTLVTINRYLNQPTLITRRLRDITMEKFVGDRILKGRATASGGMVGYEVSESTYPLGDGPETIEPGGEFPTVLIGAGRIVLEALKKIGLASEVTLESVIRSSWQPVDRAERKLSNSIIRAFDLVTMGKVIGAIPDMQTLAGAVWSDSASSIVRQLLTAKAMLDDSREGYNADTVLLDNFKWVDLASNEKLLTMLQKYNGNDSQVVALEDRIVLPGLGLEILRHPTDVGLADPIVYDSTLLGSIVREEGNDDAGDNGVTAQVRYYNAAESSPANQSEAWRVAVKRTRLPIIQEPQAAVVITGTNAP